MGEEQEPHTPETINTEPTENIEAHESRDIISAFPLTLRPGLYQKPLQDRSVQGTET